jgi:hypothetical protein
MSDPESSGAVGHSSSRLIHRRPNSDGCGVEIYISFSHSSVEDNSTTRGLTQINFANGVMLEDLKKLDEIDGEGQEKAKRFWKVGRKSKIGGGESQSKLATILQRLRNFEFLRGPLPFPQIEGTNLTFHEFVGVPMSENTLNHNSSRDVRW